MDKLLQPDVLFALVIVVIVFGTMGLHTFRKMRERELQYHEGLRIREMEHEKKMKELEIELEKAKASGSVAKVA